jgi:hypothetical protein
VTFYAVAARLSSPGIKSMGGEEKVQASYQRSAVSYKELPILVNNE